MDQPTQPQFTGATFLGRAYELKPPALPQSTIKELNFVCRQYIGSEILHIVTQEPIKTLDGIVPGQAICVPFFGGLIHAKVDKVTGTQASALSGRTIHWLEFGKDDRQAWVCGASGNLDAIARVNFGFASPEAEAKAAAVCKAVDDVGLTVMDQR